MTTTLEMLGYAPDDRVLILHADDVGFSHASNVAAFEAMTQGSLTCCSTLVPAPWFIETATLAKQHPDADIGIHMTLTAEYATYRWRSLTGGAGSPLHAPDGGMWRDVASVVQHVPVELAAAELRAQVEHALAMGIDVTHLDTHMGTVMLSKYLPPYVDLALEFRLPLFFIRPGERRLAALGADAEVYLAQARRLEERGWPLLDNVIVKTLSEIAAEDKEARFRRFLDELRPGLTHLLVHPAKGGEELEAMAPADCRHRAKEYEIFRTPALREYAEARGVKLTGYRAIRDRLRASLGGGAK
ncbi:MAG TPA: ChbG/HpnK family deacetylase [Dehalococcoidia bacterium]|nr:ChbG/HpnK family deacetylase [Dehalococcoidia bacterium]